MVSTDFLLCHFLSCANVSEYVGTITSLIEMIYWVTGEMLSENCLVDFMLKSRYFKNYKLIVQSKSGRKMVHILRKELRN